MIPSAHALCRAASALLTAVLGAAACAPVASGAVIASSAFGFDGGPALASDGRIVVGERRGSGARRLLAVDPRTRAVAELAAVGPLADPETYRELTVTGTGGIVTAALWTLRVAPPQTGSEEWGSPTLLETRAMTVLPTLAELRRCTPGLMVSPQVEAVAGTDFVATIGDGCPAAPAVHLRTTSGTIVIPAQPSLVTPGPPAEVTHLRATGQMVAWVETRMTSPSIGPERTLVIARGTTGRVLARVHLGSSLSYPLMLGLGSDGTVALMPNRDFPCAMQIVSPAAPTMRRISLPSPLCGSWDGPVAVSSGRFVYAVQSGGYAVSDLSGSVHPLAEAAQKGASPIAFDGRTAYVVRRDCDADRLLAVDAEARGTMPPAPLAAPTACKVRRAGSNGLRARHGMVRIALRCPEGCRGTLRLVQRRPGRRERIVAEARYAGTPGNVVLRPKLASFARGLAGCSGGLRVIAVLHGAGEQRHDLGTYRIASGARCRHARGPAYSKSLPAPASS